MELFGASATSQRSRQRNFGFYSGTFCTWCMLCIDCQETNTMQLPCILIFPTRGGVILHRSGGFRIHCFCMPNQGTTTKSFNQRCTDVAFHSKGTRPSWQASVLPASWFIQSPHLHWFYFETPPPMETHKKVKANRKKAKDTRTQGHSRTVIG